MNTSFSTLLSRSIRTFLFLSPSFVFGTWACLLLRLDISQELVNLQSPRFHPYTMSAAGCLLALAILSPLVFIPSIPASSLSFFEFLKKNIATLLLLLPAGAYLLLPPNFTTPSALLDRAWSSAVSSSTGASGGGKVDPETVRQFIKNSDPNAPLPLTPQDLAIVQGESELQGVLQKRQVEVLGQWVPLKDNPPGEFRLVRLVMVCCAADARPVGILTEGNAEGAQPGAWFKATGTLDFKDPRETVVLKATEIDPVDAPEEIFLY